jgi:hypothetical protein
MFMLASAKHRAFSLSDPIWFLPITERSPARRGALWRSCEKSPPHPVGRAIYRLLPGPTAAHGKAVEEWWIDGFTDLILRAVRGENMFVHARVPETVPAAVAPILEKELANEAAFGAKLENWLVQRSKR